jgi:hypothetical protein
MTNKPEVMWKDLVVVLSWDMLGGLEENHGDIS